MDNLIHDHFCLKILLSIFPEFFMVGGSIFPEFLWERHISWILHGRVSIFPEFFGGGGAEVGLSLEETNPEIFPWGIQPSHHMRTKQLRYSHCSANRAIVDHLLHFSERLFSFLNTWHGNKPQPVLLSTWEVGKDNTAGVSRVYFSVCVHKPWVNTNLLLWAKMSAQYFLFF